MFNPNTLNTLESQHFNRAVGHAYKHNKAWMGGTKAREAAAENQEINSVLILLRRRGIITTFQEIAAHVNGRASALYNGHGGYYYNGQSYSAPANINYYGNDFGLNLALEVIAINAVENAFLAAEMASYDPVFIENNVQTVEYVDESECAFGGVGDGFEETQGSGDTFTESNTGGGWPSGPDTTDNTDNTGGDDFGGDGGNNDTSATDDLF